MYLLKISFRQKVLEVVNLDFKVLAIQSYFFSRVGDHPKHPSERGAFYCWGINFCI